MDVLSLTKSNAYDNYWYFAHARQSAFLSRLAIERTEDKILAEYKFTNCYRVLDRTSQYLIKNVIYNEHHTPENTFFRIILFKLFNRIETWEYFLKRLGEVSIENFSPVKYGLLLDELKSQNSKIYSAAYIMPSGKAEYGNTSKHMNNLVMLSSMIQRELHKSIWDEQHLSGIYQRLLDTPSIGKFLAYQYSIDIAYSHHSEADESQFVVAGPGAERGINKSYPLANKKDYESIIKHTMEIQEQEFQRLELDFKYLPNRKLQLIDCQNLFCELDKYLRVKRPDLSKAGARIKQKYKPNHAPINYTFPPKWKIPEFREEF
ncbi:nucleotide kinase domain-containing protein [Pseudomonas sp. RT6P73]